MARDDDSEQEEQAAEAHEPRECMACRGSGRVISNLGGSPSSVECPWCAGTGLRRTGADAQQKWLAQSEGQTAGESETGGESQGQSSPGGQPSALGEPSDPAA